MTFLAVQTTYKHQLNRYQSSDSTTSEIDYDQLISMLNSRNIQLIDVRNKEECIIQGVIPGSVNIPG